MAKHKKKSKMRGRMIIFFSFTFILVCIWGIIKVYQNQSLSDKIKNNGVPQTASLINTSQYTLSIKPENLYSQNAVLVRLSDHKVLMQKNSKDKVYPASLTKIMTTIVGMENLHDLQEKITLPGTMFKELYEADASMAGFQPGEKVRAIDLLYGVILPSGAEACMGLANQIAGSEQSFVKLMNQKAEEIGMDDTHFVNATGLHDKNHYSTVKDLAVLLDYALKNDTFRKIFTSSSYATQSTNKHPGGMTFYSTLYQNLKAQEIGNSKILGGKTGYTDEAGLCLASLARKDGREYILITAGARGNHKSEQYNITDALSVYGSLK